MDSSGENLTVVKNNAIVEAGYRLSVYESRILLTCISKVDSIGEIGVNDTFTVSVEDLAGLTGTKGKSVYEYLECAADKLLSRLITINLQNNETLKTHWVSSVKYIPNAGMVELQFAQKIIPYISQIRREFTQYKLRNILMFKSNYSIRIYELLVKWGGNEQVISIEELKKKFQIEDKYKTIGNLKAKVIDVAMNEINIHSDMRVSYSQIKRGRSVVSIKFEYKLKNKPKQKKEFNGKVNGVSKTEIEKNARVGESYEAAAGRILALKDAVSGTL